MRDRARGDDQVQRDQEVDGAPVRRDRQPEREREHGEHREGIAARAHHAHERRDRDQRERGSGRDRRGAHGCREREPAVARHERLRRRSAHGRSSVKLRGESTVPCSPRSPTLTRYSPGRRERPAVAGLEARAAVGRSQHRVRSRLAAAAVPAQRELFVARHGMIAHERGDFSPRGVDDRDGHLVGVLELERDRLEPLLAGARGREARRQLETLHGGRACA